MNVLQKALVNAGLANEPKRRKRKRQTKEIKCRKCGKVMYKPENTNIAACECGNYIVFDGQ